MNPSLNVFSYNKGIEAFKNRDYLKAVEFMTKAMDENPWLNFIQANKIRGFAYANLKEYKNALNDFDIAINSLEGSGSEKDNIAELYFARGRVNNSLKNIKKAIDDFENCVRLNQSKIEAYRLLFFLYNENEDFDNELKTIDKIIELEPQAHWYTEKGKTLESIDKIKYLEDIVFCYRKSIELDPSLMIGYQGLAFLYFETKQFSKAIDFFSKCIQLGFTYFYYYRGLCYKNLGDINKYTNDIKKSLELGFEEAEEEIAKNNSLFTTINQILFFDTETTGVPLDWKAPASETNNWPRLVQLAWHLYDENGNLIESNCSIVKPDNFVIPKEASKVHGITTEKAYVEGENLELVLEKFKMKLEKANLLIAHNMEFDEKILGAEFFRLQNSNPLTKINKLCTMLVSTNICKINSPYGYKWPKLEELHYFLFKKGFDNAHNANADIQATADCYFEMKKRELIK